MKLDGATFLLQWAAGGLAFCWVTTRHRQVSLGFGWLLRSVYGVMAIGAVALFATQELTTARTIAIVAGIGVVLGAATALAVSVVRRRAGVRGREEVLADPGRLERWLSVSRDQPLLDNPLGSSRDR